MSALTRAFGATSPEGKGKKRLAPSPSGRGLG